MNSTVRYLTHTWTHLVTRGAQGYNHPHDQSDELNHPTTPIEHRKFARWKCAGNWHCSYYYTIYIAELGGHVVSLHDLRRDKSLRNIW